MPQSRGSGDALVFHAFSPETFGNQESKLKRLAGIESRVAMGVVPVREILFGNRLRAPEAFGDILACHLEMDAAGVRAFGPMDIEEGLHLLEDTIERAGLDTRL